MRVWEPRYAPTRRTSISGPQKEYARRTDRAPTHGTGCGAAERPDAFKGNFREGVTCLITPRVARMNACVGTAVCSDAADLDLRASKRVRQAHRSSSHPRHGLRRLGQA